MTLTDTVGGWRGILVLVLAAVLGLVIMNWMDVDAEPSREEVDEISRRIKDMLDEGKHGLAIIVGMRGVPGAKKDADNMESAFQYLNFAVFKELDPSRRKLRAHLMAAAQFPYLGDSSHDRTPCKVIAIFFAGHGGIYIPWLGKSQPYVVTGDEKHLYIDDIVSPFYPINANNLKDIKRLFFFDNCLGKKDDAGSREGESRPPPPLLRYAVPAQGNCLIAFATSPGYHSRGDKDFGGYWTRHLHQNIRQDMNIHDILATTWEHTVKNTSDLAKKKQLPHVQGPYWTACMGHLNLKRPNEETYQAPPEPPGPPTRSGPPAPAHARVPEDYTLTTSRVATDTEDSDPIEHLLNKEPIPKDLAVWLTDVQPRWSELGECLGVKAPQIANIGQKLVSNAVRLSEVLERWRAGITSDYTIKNLCKCLNELGEANTVKKIRDELQKPEVAERYSKKPDYKHYEDF